MITIKKIKPSPVNFQKVFFPPKEEIEKTSGRVQEVIDNKIIEEISKPPYNKLAVFLNSIGVKLYPILILKAGTAIFDAYELSQIGKNNPSIDLTMEELQLINGLKKEVLGLKKEELKDFLKDLANKIKENGKKEEEKGKKQLADALYLAADNLRYACEWLNHKK